MLYNVGDAVLKLFDKLFETLLVPVYSIKILLHIWSDNVQCSTFSYHNWYMCMKRKILEGRMLLKTAVLEMEALRSCQSGPTI